MTNLITEMQRTEALTVDCGYCEQPVGERCVNPRTEEPIEHQAAHFIRLAAAGKASGKR